MPCYNGAGFDRAFCPLAQRFAGKAIPAGVLSRRLTSSCNRIAFLPHPEPLAARRH